MDSIKETIKKTLPEKKIYQDSLDDEERFPCPHGTMVRKTNDGRLFLSECTECVGEHEEKEKAHRAKAEIKNRFDSAMRIGGDLTYIPKRFIDKTLYNYKSGSKEQDRILSICRKFIKNFTEAKEKGTSLVFCGRPGTGKTHLAYAIVSLLREQFTIAVVSTAADMTSEIKDAFKSDTETTTDISRKYSNYDFLVIDEVGVQVSSEAEKRIFFDVINKRYENMLPTLLISNLEKRELTSFVGERVMDRMKENGGVVFAFDWKSNR